MASINSRDFVVSVSPAGEKSCRLEVAPKENTDSGADVLPSLNEETGREKSEPGLSGNPGKFLVELNGEPIAEFADLGEGFPSWGRGNPDDNGEWLNFDHLVGKGSRVYGLGEKTRYLEKSGAVYEMWNRDTGGFYTHNEDPLYSSIPFYLVKSAEADSRAAPFLGVYVHQSEKTQFNVKAKSDLSRIGVALNSSEVTVYLFAGASPKDVISNYTRLTGKPFFPPRWAIGYHHSEYGKPCNQEEAVELAETFREKEIPCDALYLDIQHMQGHRDFTWDEDGFSDPEKLLDRLAELGFHAVNIVDPGIKAEPGYEVYDSGLEVDAYAKNDKGEDFLGAVWPGFCVFPDFLREDVRDWWATQNEKLLDQGVDGIWNDMNEPAIFFGRQQIEDLVRELDGKLADGDHLNLRDRQRLVNISEANTGSLVHRTDGGQEIGHAKFHNLYALYEATATWKAFKRENPNKRPFILTRAGFSGIQKYAAKWTGDNSSTWEHMKLSIYMSLNLGLSGVPFVGSDVGGFDGDVEPELLARWNQLGSVIPFFRNHSGLDTASQEPWAFGERYEKIIRKYINLRYRLLPFLYTEFFRAHRTGVPIARPLFLEFPGDEESYSVSDQFMVGDSMLVAPVVERGAKRRTVYLPPDENGRETSWLDWWSNENLSSGYHRVEAPLDLMPIFVRQGKGVPAADPVQHAGEYPNKLKIKANTGAGRDVDVKVPVYDDDGETDEFTRGNYFYGVFHIRAGKDKPELEVKHDGYDPFWDEVEVT